MSANYFFKIKSILKNNRRFFGTLCIFTATALIAIVLVIVSNIKKDKILTRTDFALDTICTVKIYSGETNASEALDEAFALCSKYEQMLSATISSSDIYRINHSHGQTISVNEETAELIGHAIDYCKISNGAFDITILPVKELWNFSGNSDSIPNVSELNRAVEKVDYTRIKLDKNSVTLPKGMGIDLGGIAKGYIADKMAECLRGYHISSAVIDLGGNVYTLGTKPNGEKWLIGIQKPFAENGEQISTLQVSDLSVVTSGVYQRYFKKEGKIYHHILDTSSGMPCESEFYSVTIVSPNSELCDALATICMLIGYDESVKLLKNYPEVKAVMVTSNYEVININ